MKRGWEVKRLGEICDVRGGTHDSPKYQESGFPLITSKNLKSGVITYDKVKYISEADYLAINKRSKVDIGDILFAMMGTIGNPVVITKKPDYAIKNVALFKPSCNQNSFFLKYLLDSPELRDRMQSEAKGTTQKFVGLGYLRNYLVQIPPLEEQKKIVAVLDKAFAAIDLAKANIEKNLQNAKELFQSKLNEIFTQKGEGWEERTLGEIVNIKTGKLNANAMVEDGEYPFFTCSREIFSIDIYAFDCEAILLAGNNASGDFNVKHYKGKFNAYQRTYVITSKEKGVVHYSYLKHKLISHLKSLKEQSLGANTKFLKVGMIRDINLPLPSYSIQEEVVQQLDGLYKQVKQIEVQYQQKLGDLYELKKSILQKAFAGELT